MIPGLIEGCLLDRTACLILVRIEILVGKKKY